ncbi:hypothetical protein ACQEVY_30665 [Streptomyces sp. CA-288835]|uniref:hypothetical protein n=1 Tax=Streptomyces sp. CA-288835 TaxID=3240069 RepID=UPI003D8C0C37
MHSEFSGDVTELRAKSKHLDDAVRGAETLGDKFEANWAKTEGWWGERGDDEWAEKVGSQCVDEKEQVTQTVGDITGGFLALVDAVAQEADKIQRPQLQALDDLQTLSDESESRR